jgi:hypothetical protein
MASPIIQVIRLSPFILPNSSTYKRNEIRNVEYQQDNYKSRYDYTTLAYDVFIAPTGNVIFSGPPLYGLEKFIAEGEFYINNIKVNKNQITTKVLDRIQRNNMKVKTLTENNTFSWRFGSFNSTNIINYNNNSLFKNKNVLFSKSQNNEPSWIVDWINFYVKKHKIDSVLLYDNNSTAYSILDLKEYLQKHVIHNIDIVLISWNFNYGPAGGFQKSINKLVPWDSDFCQYGIMEHAKERFLANANLVINVDIDELIMTKSKKTIIDLIGKNTGIKIRGKWIENIPNTQLSQRKFHNYFYFDKLTYEGNTKWCVRPQTLAPETQWCIHTIPKGNLKISKNGFYAHFKAINTSWQFDRSTITFDPKIHRVDFYLKNQLEKIFEVKRQTIFNHKLLTLLQKIRVHLSDFIKRS